MGAAYRNTEHMILEMLAAHRAGVSSHGLAQPLGMNSDHIALIGRSLERRGLATLRGQTLVITAAGRRVLARARGEGGGRKKAKTATTEPKTVAAPRPAPRRRATPRRAPARRRAPHPPKPQTILTDLHAMWKAVTSPLRVAGRQR